MTDKLYYYGWEQEGELNGVKLTSDYFSTMEEAEAFAAKFPKATKLRARGISGFFGDKQCAHEQKFYVGHEVFMRSTGVNKGINETGIKRLQLINKAAAKAGVELVYKNPRISNATRVEWLEGGAK